MTDEEI